jgi:serine/threonine protein kinase
MPRRPEVPGYVVVRELGQGGMGVVYLARRTLLNRSCALTMILAGDHATPDTSVRRSGSAGSGNIFLRTQQLRLSHPPGHTPMTDPPLFAILDEKHFAVGNLD